MSDGRDTFIDYSDDPTEASIQSQRHELEDAPGVDDEPTDLQPSSTLPLGQLDALEPEERRRAARKRGLSWPTTDDARDQLFDTIATVMRNEDDRVVDAPTALGKSGTIARTRWGARGDITGGKPVVHLSATRAARDEAAEAAHEYGGEHIVLKGRDEACPVAAGDFDPPDEDEDCEDLDHDPITINGQAASDWIGDMCNGRGLAFSTVHRYLEEHMDQSGELPCCRDTPDPIPTYWDDTTAAVQRVGAKEDESLRCPAIEQWDDLREGDHPLVIATHQFAHVPGLRMHTNVVLDERPEYQDDDLDTARVRDMVGAYLREIDARVKTWEDLIQTARYEDYRGHAADAREQLRDDLGTEPDRDWYFEADGAHTLAPGITRAIFHAESRANGRRVGKTAIEPPRLDASAQDDEPWNKEWLTVILDEETNDVLNVRVTPDFTLARSVVGLDAHPSLPVWQVNSLPHIRKTTVLDADERQLWRRYERGLRVVQVGDAARPGASGRYYDNRGTEALLQHLRDHYSEQVRTAISTLAVEDRVKAALKSVGVSDHEVMHYGDIRSRNDFAGERVGTVLNCRDPGDDYVLNVVAELDLNATPERSETPCDECDGEGCRSCDGLGHKRAHGRGFVGPDADSARATLAAIRENDTAQAAGRYARRASDPESHATVFVRTNAMPPGFADMQVPGVTWLATDKQRAVLDELRDATEKLSARDLADRADVHRSTAYRTLKKVIEADEERGTSSLDLYEGDGRHGATLYAADGEVLDSGVDYDLVHDRDPHPSAGHVEGPYTWAATVREPTQRGGNGAGAGSGNGDRETAVEWDWRAAARASAGEHPPPS